MPDQAIACICRLALGVQLGLDLDQFDQRGAVAWLYAKAQYPWQMGAAAVVLGPDAGGPHQEPRAVKFLQHGQ